MRWGLVSFTLYCLQGLTAIINVCRLHAGFQGAVPSRAIALTACQLHERDHPHLVLFPCPIMLTAVLPAPPYDSSQSSGWPICFACTRIW